MGRIANFDEEDGVPPSWARMHNDELDDEPTDCFDADAPTVCPEPLVVRELGAEALQLRDEALTRYAAHLGRASHRKLFALFTDALAWAETNHDRSRGATFDRFVWVVLRREWRRFIEEHSGEKLWRERRDEVERQNAERHEDALIHYWKRWENRLKKLMVAYPGRWRVGGMSADELLGELKVQLLAAVRDPSRMAPFERPGAEGTYIYLVARNNSLRKLGRKFDATGTDHPQLLEMVPNPEDMINEFERARLIAAAVNHPPARLTRRQKEWLSQFRIDVLEHGDLSDARVAELRGCNRSSATRAKMAIRAALKSIGAQGLLS